MQSAAQISQVGQDIDQGEPDVARISVKISELVTRLQRYTSSLESCRVPVISAIQGYCIGAGIDMTSACDIRLCSKDAKFTIKEVDIGICADLGTIQRFQKVVGNDSWVRELAYTARYFDADEAQRYGYVSTVYDDKSKLMDGALKLAQDIAKKSPLAINITKQSLIYSRDHTVAEGLAHIALLNGVMLQTDDTKLAVAANFSKKTPTFAKL